MLNNPLADPIRFKLQPQGKKLWFLRPTTSTSRFLEPRPKVLISSTTNKLWYAYSFYARLYLVGWLQIQSYLRKQMLAQVSKQLWSFYGSRIYTCTLLSKPSGANDGLVKVLYHLKCIFWISRKIYYKRNLRWWISEVKFCRQTPKMLWSAYKNPTLVSTSP